MCFFVDKNVFGVYKSKIYSIHDDAETKRGWLYYFFLIYFVY